MLRDAMVLPPELEAVTVKLAVALTAVGVPLITPVLGLRFTPAGRAGLTLYELTAPPAALGLFAGIGVPLV
jgi:hypothetical protein